MKLIIFWLSCLLWTTLAASSSNSNDNNPSSSSASSDSSASGNPSKDKNDKDDDDNKKEDDPKKDGDSKGKTGSEGLAYIRINEPLYLENIKSASIPISRPVTFRWAYVNTPRAPPKSLTLTLYQNKGSIVTYVIERNISTKTTSYTWDIPAYRPSENIDEAINLRIGGIYKMFLHDSDYKYDAQYVKGSYKPGVSNFVLYLPSDPSNPFGGNSINLPSLVSVTLILFSSLFITFH